METPSDHLDMGNDMRRIAGEIYQWSDSVITDTLGASYHCIQLVFYHLTLDLIACGPGSSSDQ